MPAGEDGDQQLLDDFVLADHDARHLLAQAPMGLLQPGQILQIGRHIVGGGIGRMRAVGQSCGRSGTHHMALMKGSGFRFQCKAGDGIAGAHRWTLYHSPLVNRQELIW